MFQKYLNNDLELVNVIEVDLGSKFWNTLGNTLTLNLVHVDTANVSEEVLKNKKNGFDLIDKIDVLTGLDGDKEKEGDLKTPLGVYRLTSILKNVDKFYGPFAFETSYPNMLDKLKNKDGHGIWIHGKPLKGNRDNNNTKGCIVMDNDKLEKLKNEINYKNTYLLISETTPLTATKEEIAKILAFIYKWRRAWRESNFDKYKTFYDASFKKYDGMNLKDFLDYKKRILKTINKNITTSILASEISKFKNSIISVDETKQTAQDKFYKDISSDKLISLIGDDFDTSR